MRSFVLRGAMAAITLAASAAAPDPSPCLTGASRSENGSHAEVAASFPPELLTDTFIEANAAGEPYLRKCSGRPSKIVLFLHTWNGDYRQISAYPAIANMTDACLVSPNFNGPNRNPNACASEDAMARIDNVVHEVRSKTGLQRVYLVGASGGDLAALNYLGVSPGTVRRASIWVPIYNLADFYFDAAGKETFQADLVACFGRPPTSRDDALYISRSPRGHLSALAGPIIVFINAGLRDTLAPPAYAQAASVHLRGACADCNVHYVEWDMTHEFKAWEAVKQLLGEDAEVPASVGFGLSPCGTGCRPTVKHPATLCRKNSHTSGRVTFSRARYNAFK